MDNSVYNLDENMQEETINNQNNDPSLDNDLIFIYNLRKSLICISTLTLFLTAIDIINSLYMFVPFFLVLLGSFGFCYYNKWFSLLYILYNFVKIGSDIYIILNTKNDWIILLLTITILFEIYLIELTSRFCISLWYLSTIKLNILKNNYRPSRYYLVYY